MPRGASSPDVRRRLLEDVERDLADCAGTTGVAALSPAIAAALLAVPREAFVPDDLRPLAWENRPLPIGFGQTISQPTIVALMTELLAVGPSARVLEVGTGSGYQAAILAQVLPEGDVRTLEIIPELATAARDRLRNLGVANVSFWTGNGREGLPEQAPFAGILVTAVADEVPAALPGQLAPGGRLVLPLRDPDGSQWLTVVQQSPDGTWTNRRVLPVRFLPLTGASA